MNDTATQDPAPKKIKAPRTEPKMLSYERSLYPTDAAFYGVVDGVSVPIPVTTKATLGTQSQFHADENDVPAAGNPQRVETAQLPSGCSTLKIEFSLTVAGFSLRPHACDVPNFRVNIMRFSQAYQRMNGFKTIGARIAQNIANARWAWKNRLLASDFKVQVSVSGGGTFTYDALAVPMDSFEGVTVVDTLAAVIADGLSGRTARLKVTGTMELSPGAVVFPSQEFADKDDRDESAVGKILYGIPVHGCPRCAAFHEQKIGNALRTIDDWHTGAEQDGVTFVRPGEPLPVNPYGQARESFTVVRKGSKTSGNENLYELLKRLPELTAEVEAGVVTPSSHFVMANLIRGGVFGFGKDEKDDKKAKAGKDAE